MGCSLRDRLPKLPWVPEVGLPAIAIWDPKGVNAGQMVTSKARASSRGGGRNGSVVPTPEVAAATKPLAGTGHSPHIPGNLCSLALLRNTQLGANSPRGAHKPAWTVATSYRPCLQQAPFSSVQSLSRVWLFATPWIAAYQASLSITNPWSLLKLMPIKLVMPSNHLILCCPLLLLPPIPPSIRGFSNKSTLCMRWPKYWSFSFSISPSNEHPELISFRKDSLDLFALQGTLKSLLQQHSSKASIFQHSAFFTVQLSHPCMTTGKTIALTRRTFVGKVMSLFFNMLSRLVITFLPP